jgi:ATP-dependent helicase/nuclease subunit A
MEGVMDLLYRLDGELWIADYKTDVVSSDQAVGRAEQYRPQGEVYKAAVRQSLKLEPRFHCLFLRCAMAVEL